MMNTFSLVVYFTMDVIHSLATSLGILCQYQIGLNISFRTSRTIINNKNYSVSLYNDNHVVRIDKKSKIYIKNSFKSSLNIF